MLAAIGLCWLMPVRAGAVGALAVLGALAIPAFLPALFAVLPRRTGVRLGSHVKALGADARIAALQTALSIALLADEAWRMGDAIVRTLIRLGVTHRRLLEWTTAAQTSGNPPLDLRGFYRSMACGTALGVVLPAAAMTDAPSHWPLALPFLIVWLVAPAFALGASRSPRRARAAGVSASDALELRLIARRTWRFFETFVTPADNMLPPDNFQETPKPVVAHRTSPTNLGLYLLSAVAARDFGWAGTVETTERLEATLISMQRLPRFKGHFYNWYGTLDLQALAPAYVSSVDSGNLAGHLIALANACEEWLDASLAPAARAGMIDTLLLAREAAALLSPASSGRGKQLASILDEIDAQLRGPQTLEALSPGLTRLVQKAAKTVRDSLPVGGDDSSIDLTFWIDALARGLVEHERDRQQGAQAPHLLQARLRSIAETSRGMALGMDFAFLLDPERMLMSIAIRSPTTAWTRVATTCWPPRRGLASLFAIAKGDVATRHWFRLGRAATPGGQRLGADLVVRLDVRIPDAVAGHARAGRQPARTDQPSRGATADGLWARARHTVGHFGVGIQRPRYRIHLPVLEFRRAGLGLKRGLAENRVIAPYATGLAAMIDPARRAAELCGPRDKGRVGPLRFLRGARFHACAPAR